MAKNNHSIGNAGEFYVLAQLAQRGYIAGKTDDGQTLIDVIATDPETLRTVNLKRVFLSEPVQSHCTTGDLSRHNSCLSVSIVSDPLQGQQVVNR